MESFLPSIQAASRHVERAQRVLAISIHPTLGPFASRGIEAPGKDEVMGVSKQLDERTDVHFFVKGTKKLMKALKPQNTKASRCSVVVVVTYFISLFWRSLGEAFEQENPPPRSEAQLQVRSKRHPSSQVLALRGHGGCAAPCAMRWRSSSTPRRTGQVVCGRQVQWRLRFRRRSILRW